MCLRVCVCFVQQCVRVDSRAVLMSRPARSLCYQAEEPPQMPMKKQQAASESKTFVPCEASGFSDSLCCVLTTLTLCVLTSRM